jgi:hypothetical protein
MVYLGDADINECEGTMTHPPLPVTVTERRTNMRTGRAETWAATAPGWQFIRTEEPGTPWYALCADLDEVATFGSLLDARRAAANGLRETMIDNSARRAARA